MQRIGEGPLGARRHRRTGQALGSFRQNGLGFVSPNCGVVPASHPARLCPGHPFPERPGRFHHPPARAAMGRI